MVSSCWACALVQGDPRQHKSPWFYIGSEGVVVEDIDPRGHVKRLLFVPVRHVAAGEQTEGMLETARKLLQAVALAVCANEGLRLVGIKTGNHSYPVHWHAHALLDKEGTIP